MQTLGWSPDRLAALTWTVGGMLGGLAAVLAAPLTGLSAITFTIVVTVAGLGAALLGGFHSFPLTLVGGLIIGVGEAMATLYGGDITDLLDQELITGLNRMPAFLVIFLVVVVRGRGLPLRSHVAARLPRLGTGQISLRAVLVASAVTLVLLFGVMDDPWARATYTSLAAAVMILSIVVITGYAGQISLAQWALAGIGALIAGRFVHAGLAVEVSILLGILLTIPVGLGLRGARRCGPAASTSPSSPSGLGFLVSEVVFANPHYLGDVLDGGTRIDRVELFGIQVDAFNHPHAWAAVSLVCFVLLALLVANLRRSRTGRRLPRRAHQRAGGGVARHLRVRREALRLRGVGRPRRRRRHPRRLPQPGRHLRRVQRVRLDQQPRARRDRRPRLRARRRLRRAQRHRRLRHPRRGGLDQPRRPVGPHPRVARSCS